MWVVGEREEDSGIGPKKEKVNTDYALCQLTLFFSPIPFPLSSLPYFTPSILGC